MVSVSLVPHAEVVEHATLELGLVDGEVFMLELEIGRWEVYSIACFICVLAVLKVL